jgi:prepilin-type N-terminal cleavage/methylation domain-containing protein
VADKAVWVRIPPPPPKESQKAKVKITIQNWKKVLRNLKIKTFNILKEFFKQSYPQFNLTKNAFIGIMAIGMEYKVYLSKSWSRINLIKRFLIMGQKISQRGQRKGFTLVELLVVLALISILAVILLVAIRPFEIFKKARDAQRIADLNRIDQIITVIYTQDFSFSELNYASPNVVYISLKDSSATCTSWLSQLPSLPSGWSYRCSATPTSMNGELVQFS